MQVNIYQWYCEYPNQSHLWANWTKSSVVMWSAFVLKTFWALKKKLGLLITFVKQWAFSGLETVSVVQNSFQYSFRHIYTTNWKGLDLATSQTVGSSYMHTWYLSRAPLAVTVEKFQIKCVEKNWANIFVCGEKMTNIMYSRIRANNSVQFFNT